MPIFSHPDRPLVIAHRGLSAEFPENTLPAFAAAVEAGADFVDLDYHTTHDDVLVCVHDTTLRRYIGQAAVADTPVPQLSYDQLRRIDIGKWKGAQFAGTCIPTLEDALRAILSSPRPVVPLIERKSGTCVQALKVLERAGAMGKVIVQSFDWAFLTELHGRAPGVAIAALENLMPVGPRMAELVATGAEALHLADRNLGLAEVVAAHGEELAMWVYTVDSELAMRGARSMKIDGVTTNRADKAARLFGT